MENSEFLEYLRSGNIIQGGTESHRMMCGLSEDAIRVCMEINSSYHSPEEIRSLFSRLTGKTVDETFSLFPPFYTECGKNIFVGKNVFINFCCHFQDQGGIYIGDGTFIGSEVVVATINHGTKSSERGVHCLSPVHIGKNVWIGSHATILPGVTIGDNSVIAAGAVVTKDVPDGVIAGGVPARILRNTDE